MILNCTSWPFLHWKEWHASSIVYPGYSWGHLFSLSSLGFPCPFILWEFWTSSCSLFHISVFLIRTCSSSALSSALQYPSYSTANSIELFSFHEHSSMLTSWPRKDNPWVSSFPSLDYCLVFYLSWCWQKNWQAHTLHGAPEKILVFLRVYQHCWEWWCLWPVWTCSRGLGSIFD